MKNTKQLIAKFILSIIFLIVFSASLSANDSTQGVTQAESAKTAAQKSSELLFEVTDDINGKNRLNTKLTPSAFEFFKQVDPDQNIYDSTDFALDLNIATLFITADGVSERDKYKHLLVGSLISIGSVYSTKLILWLRGKDTDLGWRSRLVSLSLATVAALGKEYYDSLGNGQVEARDVIYTILGGAVFSYRFTF